MENSQCDTESDTDISESSVTFDQTSDESSEQSCWASYGLSKKVHSIYRNAWSCRHLAELSYSTETIYMGSFLW